MKITGAAAVLESLLCEGVEVVFGYPGGQVIPIYDALYDYSRRLRHVLVRHEQGAVHACDGYARATRRPGVCIATSGPGATNLVTGIANAMLDSVPILCITGQVPMSVIGSDAFQETDVIGITATITKWNYQIAKAHEIPEIVKKALYIARSGRPGPVLLDITKDAQTGLIEFNYPKSISIPNYSLPGAPQKSDLEPVARLLNQAKKPLFIVGHGVRLAKAEGILQKVVEKGDFPVATTLHGLSSIPCDHPNYMGWVGMHGNYAPNLLTNEADVICSLGMRFDDRVTGKVEKYANQAKIIHIDIDPAEIDKNVKSHVAVIADVKLALEQLEPLIDPIKRNQWHTHFHQLMEVEHERIVKGAVAPSDGYITMAETINLLSEKTQGQARIVSDVGQNQMMAARYYRFRRLNSYFSSGGLGTMGFGLPAAVGVQIAFPDDLVITCCGDGGFQMNIQELGTIVQENLPIKIIILNNSYLGMVRQWQELFFDKRYSGVSISSPDFVKVAQAYGIEAQAVTERSQLVQALDSLINSKSSYLLEVRVAEEENVFPMIPSGRELHEMILSR